MTLDQLAAFMEKVKSDIELQEKLKSVTSVEAGVEIAKEAGFSITLEDIQTLQSKSSEVSDQELENAAGGFTIAAMVAMATVAAIPVITEKICDR